MIAFLALACANKAADVELSGGDTGGACMAGYARAGDGYCYPIADGGDADTDADTDTDTDTDADGGTETGRRDTGSPDTGAVEDTAAPDDTGASSGDTGTVEDTGAELPDCSSVGGGLGLDGYTSPTPDGSNDEATGCLGAVALTCDAPQTGSAYVAATFYDGSVAVRIAYDENTTDAAGTERLCVLDGWGLVGGRPEYWSTTITVRVE